MANYSAEDCRNIAFVGGADSGKTSLIDALLFKGGAVTRVGRIDDGTSISDYDQEEKDKKHSLNLSIMHLNHNKREVILLDTPGYPDFVGEAISALYASETAVVNVNAFNGIVTNTRKLWEEATKLDLAKVILINKVDMENVVWDELVESLRTFFGDNLFPVFLPDTTGSGVSFIADCLGKPEKAPDSMKDRVEEARITLMESLVENDEALMEKYLEGETIALEDLRNLMRVAIQQRAIVPILCTSQEKNLGVEETLDLTLVREVDRVFSRDAREPAAYYLCQPAE